MCFIAEKKGRPRPRIAKRDIPVWKTVDKCWDYNISDYIPNMFSSSLHGFVYERGKSYKTELKIETDNAKNSAADSIVVDRLNETYGKNNWFDNNLPELLYINEGFHSYKNRNRASSYICGAIKLKFIIPKGSEYYYDGHGCYVSNQLYLPHE